MANPGGIYPSGFRLAIPLVWSVWRQVNCCLGVGCILFCQAFTHQTDALISSSVLRKQPTLTNRIPKCWSQDRNVFISLFIIFLK